MVHSCNSLAIKAIKGANKHRNFLKSCTAFNEVTIPSVSSGSKRMNLYLETVEVIFSYLFSVVLLLSLSTSSFFIKDSFLWTLGCSSVWLAISYRWPYWFSNLLFKEFRRIWRLEVYFLVVSLPYDIIVLCLWSGLSVSSQTYFLVSNVCVSSLRLVHIWLCVRKEVKNARSRL